MTSEIYQMNAGWCVPTWCYDYIILYRE